MSIILLVLVVFQGLIFQTAELRDAYIVLLGVSVVALMTICLRHVEQLDKLTFAPLFLLLIPYALSPRVATRDFVVSSGQYVGGMEIFLSAWSGADYRYCVIVTLVCSYVAAQLFTSSSNGRALGWLNAACAVLVLAAYTGGLRPELLVLQQRSYAATLIAMTLPFAFSPPLAAAGVVSVLLLNNETGVVLLGLLGLRYAPARLRRLLYIPAAAAACGAVAHTATTAGVRVRIWLRAAQQLSLRGCGVGAFRATGASARTWFAHNAALTYISETGVLGAAVLAISVAMVYGTRGKRSRAANTALLVFATASLWDDAWQMLAVASVLGLVLATTSGVQTRSLVESVSWQQATVAIWKNKVKNKVMKWWENEQGDSNLCR